MHAELVFESHDCVGESPRWDERRGCLWWIDNERSTLHCHVPAVGDVRGDGDGRGDGATRTIPLRQNASSIALAQDTLLATMQDGLYRIDFDGTALTRLVEMDAAAEACGFNDSGCDPRGRLWIGSGSEAVAGQGRLWVVPPGAPAPTPILDGLTLPNGIGFSPDGTTMYLADSLAAVVYRIPYDLETGALAEQEVLCSTDTADGLPDGLAVDVDGGVWVAFWDGGCVRRYDSGGQLDVEVELPVRRVAGCAFGGPGRSDLYVTTATYELTEDELAAQPLAGALFRIPTGTSGVPVALVPARD